MNGFLHRNRLLLAAGSIVSAAVLVALVPFNMGGCSAGNIDYAGLLNAGKTGIQSFSIDEKKEPSLGTTVAIQVTNRYPVYANPTLNRYVTMVGRTVAASSKMPDIDYYFAVLDTPEVNAYSGPHGYVMVTRGAIAQMKDESELAGVLGHEIGHICEHHGLQAIRAAMTKQAGMQIAGSFQKINSMGAAYGALGDIALNTGFSQPQEDEADVDGVKFAIAAGYDPNGYLRFLQRMASQSSSNMKPFGTHPGMGERAKRVQDQISQVDSTGGVTNAERFAANVSLR